MSSRGRTISGVLAVIVAGALVSGCSGKSGGDAKGSDSAVAASAVRGFFTALTAGDAKTAVSYLELASGSDPAGDALLTDAALGADYRPSNVQYGAPRQQDGLTFVDVTYQARGETVRQNVALAGDGKHLRSVLVGLSVTGVQGRPVSVNGVKMGNNDLNVDVFPGSYQVAITGNVLFEGETLAVMPQVALGGETAAANFGPPGLTKDAGSALQRAVRQTLDACAATARPKTPGCPFWLDVKGTGAKVTWSIKTYPGIKSQVIAGPDGPEVTLADDGKGSAHWSGSYTDKAGHPQSGNGDIPFDVAGSAKPSDSGIKVSLAT